jgi:hypothetical protein
MCGRDRDEAMATIEAWERLTAPTALAALTAVRSSR